MKLKSIFAKNFKGQIEKSSVNLLNKQVETIFSSYQSSIEGIENVDELTDALKDLALVLEMLATGEMNDGLWLQEEQATSAGSEIAAESDSTKSEEASQSSDDRTGEESSSDRGITIFKDADGKTRWLGIVSNNYTDRHAELITKDAHLDFVRAVKASEYPYPELRFQHQEDMVIGKSDYLEFDETTGMLIASGFFLDGYEEIGENLAKSTDLWGMSHGMPKTEIQRQKENQKIITRYRSKEVSFLKLNKAANPLTHAV